MKAPTDAIATCLEAVERARTADDFYRADECIRRLPDLRATDATTRAHGRRRTLDLWLRAIDKVDRTIDPEFDPSDVPEINVAPPIGAEIPAGANPSAIKDPKLRREYEEAIKANAQKADRCRLQHLLRRLDTTWSTQMRAFVRSQYTTTEQDVQEIRDLIDTVLSSAERKKTVKGALLSK